jgi:hypothetical protein
MISGSSSASSSGNSSSGNSGGSAKSAKSFTVEWAGIGSKVGKHSVI